MADILRIHALACMGPRRWRGDSWISPCNSLGRLRANRQGFSLRSVAHAAPAACPCVFLPRRKVHRNTRLPQFHSLASHNKEAEAEDARVTTGKNGSLVSLQNKVAGGAVLAMLQRRLLACCLNTHRQHTCNTETAHTYARLSSPFTWPDLLRRRKKNFKIP